MFQESEAVKRLEIAIILVAALVGYGTLLKPSQLFRDSSATRISKEVAIHQSQISFQLVPCTPGSSYNESFNPYYQCRVEPGVRQPLYQELQEVEGLFDFTTHITTSLKLLLMGDSVGIQFSQLLEEAAGASVHNRSVLRYSWGLHEGLHISAPVRGGGAVAGWRITGMLSRRRENTALPNSGGGGWVRSDVEDLLNYTYITSNGTNVTVQSFDVFIFRLPMGWIKLDEITTESLTETVEMANELFGVRYVILTTCPFSNNIMAMSDIAKLNDKNRLLREFATNWKRGAFGVDQVLLLDFYQLTQALMEWNGRFLKFDTSVTNYSIATLNCCPRRGFYYHVAQVCAVPVSHMSGSCERNMFTLDGLHQCMATIGGRFYAGLACLVGCTQRDALWRFLASNSSDTLLRDCERTCNDCFLSLTPLNQSCAASHDG
jgi:hypothetical protein